MVNGMKRIKTMDGFHDAIFIDIWLINWYNYIVSMGYLKETEQNNNGFATIVHII